MQRHNLLLIIASTLPVLASPPAEDRKAILALAGEFHVNFDFSETAAIAQDYQRKSKPYHEKALEKVILVEDTPERITLQHLLVVPTKNGSPKVIKHWAQVWTWQDPITVDFAGSEGDDRWIRRKWKPQQTAGRWSQLVTNVDDTPRYESLGSWSHQLGESSWTSDPTRRPLPRREYSKRDDYDYLLVINRQTLTPDGWIHFQDNRKIVDRDGKTFVLAHETGLNRYTRTTHPSFAIAADWWKNHQQTWNPIREFWINAIETTGETFSYSTHANGMGLSERLELLQSGKPSVEEITSSLAPYIIK